MSPEITVTKTIDLWDGMKKFANSDIMQIAEILYKDGALELKDLRQKTKLNTNDLNHRLIEMRSVDIVIKIGPQYQLTFYGAVLLDSIKKIKQDIFRIPKENMLLPRWSA